MLSEYMDVYYSCTLVFVWVGFMSETCFSRDVCKNQFLPSKTCRNLPKLYFCWLAVYSRLKNIYTDYKQMLSGEVSLFNDHIFSSLLIHITAYLCHFANVNSQNVCFVLRFFCSVTTSGNALWNKRSDWLSTSAKANRYAPFIRVWYV